MTLLGEIYAQGLGVGRDDAKAAQWYKLAVAKGDRDAMFALAMFNFQGRAATRDLNEAARLLESAARLGHAGAAYNLGLLYMQGEQIAQDFKRAGELFALAAEAGNPEAQYALATMYKEGRGVGKDATKAMRLMQQASIAGNLDSMVEFAIAQFNGDGTPKDEAAAGTAVPESGAPRQPDRTESARPHFYGRSWHACGPDRSGQMAHDCEGRRCERPRPRRFHQQANSGRARRRRQGRQEMAVDRGARPPLTTRAITGRPHASCKPPLC